MSGSQAKGSQAQLLDVLLDRHGRTFSDELGIDLAKNTPSPLFRWLCASLLLSARISSSLAMKAAKALFEAGWTTAEKMAASTWQDRVRTLNQAGYGRYDESTARMLGETTAMLVGDYGGDLRKLRARAQRSSGEERRLLKAFKGIGDVGVDIFFREAQMAWDELCPFADRKALQAADRLGLATSTEELSTLVSRSDFPRLVAALVRTSLEHDFDDIAREAGDGARG